MQWPSRAAPGGTHANCNISHRRNRVTSLKQEVIFLRVPSLARCDSEQNIYLFSTNSSAR
jgi:hypothetical protein